MGMFYGHGRVRRRFKSAADDRVLTEVKTEEKNAKRDEEEQETEEEEEEEVKEVAVEFCSVACSQAFSAVLIECQVDNLLNKYKAAEKHRRRRQSD